MNPQPIFRVDPQIELLQWLARGSLKQNLLRAIRLWVWLKTLYGEENLKLELPHCFTLCHWRMAFFTESHPTGDQIPNHRDLDCACTKTTAEWLFTDTALSESEWQQALQQHSPIPTAELEQLLKRRLFAITRRSLQGDLKILSELGWLKYQKTGYYLISEFPVYPQSEGDAVGRVHSPILNLDLGAIAENFNVPLNHYHRFFLDVDYIVPKHQLDLVEDWQDQLKQIWSKDPIPPVQLTYHSVRQNEVVQRIVYPICIYYVRRALYLCTYGESVDFRYPGAKYRLDRVQAIAELSWEDPQIPQVLLQAWRQRTLPTPDTLAEELEAAWGFDFYAPKTLLLLRFERDFHDRYIQQTYRHSTFKPVTLAEIQKLVQEYATPDEQLILQQILQQRPPEDVYYRVWYRDGDVNVIQRLRAWRPFGEVLLPWSLREKMRAEVLKEADFYQNP